MNLKGSKTEQNLMAAFAGESQARNKYTYYASKAKKEGYNQIAAISCTQALQKLRVRKASPRLLTCSKKWAKLRKSMKSAIVPCVLRWKTALYLRVKPSRYGYAPTAATFTSANMRRRSALFATIRRDTSFCRQKIIDFFTAGRFARLFAVL